MQEQEEESQQQVSNQQQGISFLTSILREMTSVHSPTPIYNLEEEGRLTNHNNIHHSPERREEIELARTQYRLKMEEPGLVGMDEDMDEEMDNPDQQGKQQKENQIKLKQVINFVYQVITEVGQIPKQAFKQLLINKMENKMRNRLQQKQRKNFIRRCYDSVNVLIATSRIEQLPNKSLTICKTFGLQAEIKKQELQRQIREKEWLIRAKKDSLMNTKDSMGRLELLLKRNIELHNSLQDKIYLNLIAYMKDEHAQVPKLQKKGNKIQIHIPRTQLLPQSQLLQIIQQSYREKQ